MVFNMNQGYTFEETSQGQLQGTTIKGKTVNNIGYTDDSNVFTDALNELQRPIDAIIDAGYWMKLKINSRKIKAIQA